MAPQLDRYVFIPSYSLTPNKLVSFNSVFIRNKEAGTLKHISEKRSMYSHINVEKSIKRSSHNFKISDSANKNLKQKINWLYYLSKARFVKTYSGKELFNFKMCFLTLTLPSKQKHPTKECTKLYLNTFLTEVRERTKMENYVWRLEFQKNGNVHYHLCTDTFLDYHFVRKIWNKILGKYGYIQDYKNKFQNLSLSDYNNLVNHDRKVDFKIIAKRYATGKKNNWENAPSVDVKSVVSNKTIAGYISKYFSKDSDSNTKCNELDNSENSQNLRLWFCSRSLSKLKTVNGFCEANPIDLFALVTWAEKLKVKHLKYAKLFFFELSNFPHKIRSIFEKILKDYSISLNYYPAKVVSSFN